MDVVCRESLSFTSSDVVATNLDKLEERIGSECVLIDVRPHGDFVKQHIKSAVHLHVNPMQMRRLCKGICELDSVVADQRCKQLLRKRFSSNVDLIVYDDVSGTDLVSPGIKNYLDILRRGLQGSLHVLNGGFRAFTKDYGHLCQTTPEDMNEFPPLPRPPTLSLTNTPRPYVACRQELLSSPQLPSCPPTEILPHLYIGTSRDSGNLELLSRLGITAVLNVSSSCQMYFEDTFTYKRIAVEDAYHEDLLSRFREAAEFIDEVQKAGGRVLVHCYAGISRSATVCIAYLMLKNGWSMHQAYEFCREKRPCVSPNFNFMGQLLSYQDQLGHCPIKTTEDVCDISDEILLEDNPSGPESLVKPCPRKRPGSLTFKFCESRSADSSPSKRHSTILGDFTRNPSKLQHTTELSTSDSKLHCSERLEISPHMVTVTNRA